MRKISFYLLIAGLVICMISPAHSQTVKRFNLGFNISAFNENDPGPNLGISALGVYNLNKVMSFYVSGGYLHRKGRSNTSTLFTRNANGVIVEDQVLDVNDRTASYLPVLLGTRFYAPMQTVKPYIQLEYGRYFSLNSDNRNLIHYLDEPDGSRSVLAVGLTEDGDKSSISLGAGFLKQISQNANLDFSLSFNDNDFMEDAFRFNLGMLWDF